MGTVLGAVAPNSAPMGAVVGAVTPNSAPMGAVLGTDRVSSILMLRFAPLFILLIFFLPPILEHLFLHKIERGLMNFYTQIKQQFNSKFHKSMISMYCSFHLKLCIFLSMYPQKSCTIQGKCVVKYVKSWSLSLPQT